MISWPNLFTCFRIAITPLFVGLYLYPSFFGLAGASLPIVLLILLTLSELSDLSDGYIARKTNQVTDLGKLLDPLADSLFRSTLFLLFTQPPVHLPLWVALLFVYRDMGISTLRAVVALRGTALAARSSGKLKAVLQATSAYLVLFFMWFFAEGAISQEQLSLWSLWVTLPVALFALASGIEYVATCPQK